MHSIFISYYLTSFALLFTLPYNWYREEVKYINGYS
nr:MAG TPA: hypothetical protein [Caudoviricetes sp.]